MISDEEKERLHRLRNDFITLAEAAMLAHLRTLGGRTDTTITDPQLNAMATKLVCLITLYSLSEDQTTVRCLTPEEFGGAIISNGGRIIKFKDGRPAISGLVVTRTSLKAALATL